MKGDRKFIGSGYISIIVIIVYLLPVIFLMLGMNYQIIPNTSSDMANTHPVILILSSLSWGGVGVAVPAYIMGESLAQKTGKLLQVIYNIPNKSITSSLRTGGLVSLLPISVIISITILLTESVIIIILLYLAAWVGELIWSAAFKESTVVLGVFILLSILLPYLIKWIGITFKGG